MQHLEAGYTCAVVPYRQRTECLQTEEGSIYGHSPTSASQMPTLHSITRSARSRIDCGSVTASAFAVLRLTTKSNRVGSSMGRSPDSDGLENQSRLRHAPEHSVWFRADRGAFRDCPRGHFARGFARSQLALMSRRGPLLKTRWPCQRGGMRTAGATEGNGRSAAIGEAHRMHGGAWRGALGCEAVLPPI
jgi:hypothetical protein